MSSDIRKCVSLGPRGFLYEWGDQDYRVNRQFFLDTDTKWVRLWVWWDRAQPRSGYTDEALMQALDRQIAAANNDGRAVILCTYRYPEWATRQTAQTYTNANNNIVEPPDHGFTWPDDRSTNSPYGQWIALLIQRYGNRSRNPHINMLEVVNEPNVQGWPQRNAQGQLIAQCFTAGMFSTAQAMNNYFGNQILLGGPATAGVFSGPKYNRFGLTTYNEFTQGLLAALPDGFNTQFWVWTHHNYTDIEFGDDPELATPSAADVRRMIIAARDGNGNRRWIGAHEGLSDPLFFVTEGGARLFVLSQTVGSDPGAQRARQNQQLVREFNRMSNDTDGLGRGIGMFTNYLYYGTGAASTDDSGLREAQAAGGAPRPSYQSWTQVAPGRY